LVEVGIRTKPRTATFNAALANYSTNSFLEYSAPNTKSWIKVVPGDSEKADMPLSGWFVAGDETLIILQPVMAPIPRSTSLPGL
jgi:hypothetical protein